MYATVRGRWLHGALLLVWAVSVMVCVGPAVFGRQHWNVGGLGGFIGAAVGTRMRSGDFWRLPSPARRQVEQAVLTGVPTGSADLDRVAHERLALAVRNRSRGNTIGSAVLAVLVVAASVVASARTDDRWYLLTLAPTLVVIAVAGWTRLTRDHPTQRLTRFDDATRTSRPAD